MVTSPAKDTTEQLRGFGPIGLLALLIILAANLIGAPLSAVLVLVWAQLSQTPLRALGIATTRSWVQTFAIGIPFGIAFKLFMKAIVMPLLGAPATNAPYHYLVGNVAASTWMLFVVVVSGGIAEEIVYRGFLFERLYKLFGTSRARNVLTVLFTSALFALAHFSDQGLPGAEQAVVTGLAFGAIYRTTKQLWLPMIAHATFDLAAIALIYWNWESAVAHAVFS